MQLSDSARAARRWMYQRSTVTVLLLLYAPSIWRRLQYWCIANDIVLWLCRRPVRGSRSCRFWVIVLYWIDWVLSLGDRCMMMFDFICIHIYSFDFRRERYLKLSRFVSFLKFLFWFDSMNLDSYVYTPKIISLCDIKNNTKKASEVET